MLCLEIIIVSFENLDHYIVNQWCQTTYTSGSTNKHRKKRKQKVTHWQAMHCLDIGIDVTQRQLNKQYQLIYYLLSFLMIYIHLLWVVECIRDDDQKTNIQVLISNCRVNLGEIKRDLDLAIEIQYNQYKVTHHIKMYHKGIIWCLIRIEWFHMELYGIIWSHIRVMIPYRITCHKDYMIPGCHIRNTWHHIRITWCHIRIT